MTRKKINTMLIGAGEAGIELINDLMRHPENPIKIVCIIDDDLSKQGKPILYRLPSRWRQ